MTSNRSKRSVLFEWASERFVYLAGAIVSLMILGIGYYLAHESSYAFDRKFPFGYRFALADTAMPDGFELISEPNATLLTSNSEGTAGADDNEDGVMMPRIEELQGSGAPFGTGTTLNGDLTPAPDAIYRDNWDAMQFATKPQKFVLFGFATEEYAKPTMRLYWEPDASFVPSNSPYDLRLKLVKSPPGVQLPSIDIDLKARQRGFVEVPTFVAKTDADRASGYVFELLATPRYNSNFLATLRSFLSTEWAPTSPYPMFGVMPLLLSTMVISLIAMVMAAPVAVSTAIAINEFAPARLREWTKPVIEMLASVPTVVLAFFGLIIVAPAVVKQFGQGLQMESGRNMLTAAIIMAILILPTMVSIAEDALRSVPRALRDGAEALGLRAEESIRKVLLKAAKSGLVAALLLGFARAVGETVIVWILSGGTAAMPSLAPSGLARSVRGAPDTIGIEMGNVVFESPHYGHLFLIGLLLFVMSVAINLTSYSLSRRNAWQG